MTKETADQGSRLCGWLTCSSSCFVSRRHRRWCGCFCIPPPWLSWPVMLNSILDLRRDVSVKIGLPPKIEWIWNQHSTSTMVPCVFGFDPHPDLLATCSHGFGPEHRSIRRPRRLARYLKCQRSMAQCRHDAMAAGQSDSFTQNLSVLSWILFRLLSLVFLLYCLVAVRDGLKGLPYKNYV